MVRNEIICWFLADYGHQLVLDIVFFCIVCGVWNSVVYGPFLFSFCSNLSHRKKKALLRNLKRKAKRQAEAVKLKEENGDYNYEILFVLPSSYSSSRNFLQTFLPKFLPLWCAMYLIFSGVDTDSSENEEVAARKLEAEERERYRIYQCYKF